MWCRGWWGAEGGRSKEGSAWSLGEIHQQGGHSSPVAMTDAEAVREPVHVLDRISVRDFVYGGFKIDAPDLFPAQGLTQQFGGGIGIRADPGSQRPPPIGRTAVQHHT